MARPKAFDPDQALDAALAVFWEKGYEAASLAQLLAATGLSKSSFYAAFGSKHRLFLRVLERYTEAVVDRLVSTLAAGRSARTNIAVAFNDIVDAAIATGDRRGCLIGNAAAELAPRDAAVAERVETALGRLEDAYRQAVERAQERGEVAPGRDARELARFLVASAQGLHLMAKSARQRTSLYAVARVALACLE